MENALGQRQPSPPMKPGGTNPLPRAAVPPRGAFSAQMLRPPSTPTFSTDSPLSEYDDDFRGEMDDYAFVTSRRASSEVDNQILSPLPPPPPPYHTSSGIRRPLTARTSSMKGIPTEQRPVRAASVTKSKTHTSPRAQASTLSHDEQTRKQKPIPSVHPIDTLSKKLRQQAMELTHVYEELEKQNLQINAYKQKIQDQKRQIDKLREQRRKSVDVSSNAPTSSRAVAVEQQKRAAQMMSGTPSTGASFGQKRGELDRKLKETEREKKKYALAAKRIEKALVELQVFQNDRITRLLPSEGVSNQAEGTGDSSGDFQDVLNEQRAYIRVLEEAVHLKATDFEVTGHEELLVVLAELRHTIFEQEKDVQEKSHLLSSMQEQLEQEQQEQIVTKDLFTATQKQQEDMAKHFQDQESLLQGQLNDVKRQLQERDRRLEQLRDVSTNAQRTEEALQTRLAAAMKAQNVTGAKLEDATRSVNALQAQLQERTTKYEGAQQQVVALRDETTKKQGHLDEMNALQEELLGSVDKYVGKAKKLRGKVERLEAELQSHKEKEARTTKQSEDAEERVAALQAKVDTAEQRTQDIRAQCTALEQERNRLESTLAEVQQNVDVQIQESNEQLRRIASKEQKCHQVDEAVAELEAALSTALQMMRTNTSEVFKPHSMAEDDADITDGDEHAVLLNELVLYELETCCQALSTLTMDTGPTQCLSLCPSLSELVARVATIGKRVVTEVNQGLASWARERANLMEACTTLNATATICQTEMEKRHDEVRNYREQLAKCTSEIEIYAMQVNNLDEQLHNAHVQDEAYRTLEEHVVHQEEALEAKRALIRHLSAANDRLAEVEKAYSAQVAANARYAQQLQYQQEAIKEQTQVAGELEQALENAAIFVEQQNDCNQQLNTQLAELETSQREQAHQVKTLEVQYLKFSSRFQELVKQYATSLRPIAATNRSLQDHLNLLNAELHQGDVLRLLQLFPALVEDYISTCTSNPEQNVAINLRDQSHWRDSESAMSSNQNLHPLDREKPQAVEMATSIWHLPSSEPPASKISSLPTTLNSAVTRDPQYSMTAEKEEAQLAEQLELIRGAFLSYKDDVKTER